MMNKLKFLLSLAVILSVFACADEEENLPEGTIRDSEGLNIELEWDTGGSTAQSQEDTDLELYLKRDGDVIQSSTSFSDFEEVFIDPVYGDGTYIIEIDVYSIDVDTDYTLFVRGASGSGETMTFNSSFSSTDVDVTVEYLRIVKSGNDYTVTDL